MASELRITDGSSEGTQVKGSWGTKVTAVVDRVLSLPDCDKCLIFSQWDDLLTLISKSLTQNGLEHCRLQGRQTFDAELHAFRTKAEVRALLLPLKSGANGINLVEAQHVFLVEPLIETAVEAQAIGRVHRMSQLKPTTVHRFVVRGTIEEAIVGLRSKEGGVALEADTINDGTLQSASNDQGQFPLAGAGSPSKRATRKVEEAKVLSWDHVVALFSS